MPKHPCIRCGELTSPKRSVCVSCAKLWTGTHYGDKPAKDGDALNKRLPGSFGSKT